MDATTVRNGTAHGDSNSQALFRTKDVSVRTKQSNISIVGGRFDGNSLESRIFSLYGDNIHLRDFVVVGWEDARAIAIAGDNITVEDFSLHAGTGGVGADGVHVSGGNDIVIRRGHIDCGDDMVSIVPDATGPWIDDSITNVLVSDITGTSTDSRALAVGFHNSVLTGTVKGIRVERIHATSQASAAGTAHGGVAILNMGTGSSLEDIVVANSRFETTDGTTTCVIDDNGTGNVTTDVLFDGVYFGPGGEDTVRLIALLRGCVFHRCTMDATGSGGRPIEFNKSGADIDGVIFDKCRLICGGDDGVWTNRATNCKFIDLRIKEIENTFHGFNLSISGSGNQIIRPSLHKRSGATTSRAFRVANLTDTLIVQPDWAKIDTQFQGDPGVVEMVGTGTPESAVAAAIGSRFYDRTNGVAYLKRSGTGNTGWVRLNNSAVVAFADADATPSVSGGTVFKTANTSATTITDFDDGVDGQEITVIFGDGNTTVDFTGTSLKGNAGADWTPASGDHMTCIYDGTNWHCAVSDNTA